MRGIGGAVPIVVFIVAILLASSIPIQFQATAQPNTDVGYERVLVYIHTDNEKRKDTITSRSDVKVR